MKALLLNLSLILLGLFFATFVDWLTCDAPLHQLFGCLLILGCAVLTAWGAVKDGRR